MKRKSLVKYLLFFSVCMLGVGYAAVNAFEGKMTTSWDVEESTMLVSINSASVHEIDGVTELLGTTEFTFVGNTGTLELDNDEYGERITLILTVTNNHSLDAALDIEVRVYDDLDNEYNVTGALDIMGSESGESGSSVLKANDYADYWCIIEGMPELNIVEGSTLYLEIIFTATPIFE